MEDLDEKAISVTHLFFKTPSYKRTLAYLAVGAFILGIIARAISPLGKETILENFLYGGADGVLLFALPAIIASVLATALVSRKKFKAEFRHFSFIALIASWIYAIFVIAGLAMRFVPKAPAFDVSHFILLGNAFVLIFWLASSWIILSYKKKSFLLCLLHPLANISFIILWNTFILFQTSFAITGSPLLAVFKLIVASIVLLIAMGALAFIINAPTKRNFGISTIDAITMFFAQWVSGSKGLENVLAETGEIVRTEVSTILFNNKRGQTKALFVVPQIHYGPIGNLGGSEFPGILSTELGKTLGAPAFIFKGTANHDFNPIYSSSVSVIQQAALDVVKEHASEKKKIANNQEGKFALLQGRAGYSEVFGFEVDNSAFLTLCRAPKNCEDIHQALGRSLANRTMALGFKQATLVDRHNCKIDGTMFGPGSKEYYEYENAITGMKKTPIGSFKLGVAQSNVRFAPEEGIGQGGIKVAIFETRGKQACLIVVDANNCIPEFRDQLLSEVKKKNNFNFVDVLTTDSHAVNSINGIHNPLGERLNKNKFIEEVHRTIETALENREECTGHAGTRQIEIEVLGPQRTHELVITINSIIAILKIIAPVVFIGSLALALAAMLFIK